MLLKTFIEQSINALNKLEKPLDDNIQKELDQFILDPDPMFQIKVEGDPIMLILSQTFLMLKYPRLSATFTFLIALIKGKENELKILKEKVKKEMQK